jgi:hypothetical protein
MRNFRGALDEKQPNFAPDPDALSRVSGQRQRDCRKTGARTIAQAPRGTPVPALGRPRSRADDARTATTSFVRWATLMPVNFATRRSGQAGQERNSAMQHGVFLVLPERLWSCIVERYLLI